MGAAPAGLSGMMQTLAALEYACTLDVLPALKKIFASGQSGPYFAKGYVFCFGADAVELVLHSDRETLSMFENKDFHTIANEDGDAHIAHRKEIMPAFSPAMFSSYGESAGTLAARIFVGHGGIVNLHEVTEAFVLELLWETMLGEPFAMRPKHVLEDYQILLARADNGARLRAASIRRSRERWFSYLKGILSARLQNPRNDAASAIARSRQCADEVSVSHLFALMDFGLGDLTIMYTYVLALLGTHRSEQEAMRSELLEMEGTTFEKFPRTAAFVHEVERMFPAVAELHRVVKKDFVFRGVTIPEGTILVCSMWHSQRDEALFANAEEFRPARFLNEQGAFQRSKHLYPFGAGRHMCLAAVYSRNMLIPTLRELLRRVELYVEPLVPEIQHPPAQRPANPIWMRMKKRA